MDALKRLLSPRSPLSIRVSLNNDLVLVHPPAQDEDEVGSTILTGSVVISSPVSIRLATVRVGVVVAAQYSHPDWPKQQDGTIFEQHLSFLGEDAQVTPAPQGLEHRIAFDLPVQSNIPTYEFSEEVKIRAQLRVTVEYWGGPGGTTEVQGRGFIDNAKLNMARWDGGGKVNYPRHLSHPVVPEDLPPLDPGVQRHIMVDNLAIIANADPSGLAQLREVRSGRIEGLGEWTLTLQSDLFTIGSYVRPNLHFANVSPRISIYAYGLHLEQACDMMQIERFREVGVHGEWTSLPVKEWALATKGRLPKDRKTDEPLHAGGGEVRWLPDKLRLPDDTVCRSSTCLGTFTPVRYRHAVILRVYFGDSRKKDEPLTMMQTKVPVFLMNCCCIQERVMLPQYTVDTAAESSTQAVMCACCYSLEGLPESASDEPQGLPGKP